MLNYRNCTVVHDINCFIAVADMISGYVYSDNYIKLMADVYGYKRRMRRIYEPQS
jgi:hypothetical protein